MLKTRILIPAMSGSKKNMNTDAEILRFVRDRLCWVLDISKERLQ